MRTLYTDKISQTPGELRPAQINWDIELPTGITIVSSTFAADSTDYTLSLEGRTSRTTTFWLTGGVAGKIYYITNTINCSDGEVLQATVPFQCVQQNLISPNCGC